MADTGKDRMPKVDFQKDLPFLKQAEIDFAKKVERENLERVQKLQKLRRKNVITGVLLTGGVLGIYLYSMLAVKQEKFLDVDFEDPKTKQSSEKQPL